MWREVKGLMITGVKMSDCVGAIAGGVDDGTV